MSNLKWEYVDEITGEHTIKELEKLITKLKRTYGPLTKVRIDAGHNNVELEVQVKQKEPKRE